MRWIPAPRRTFRPGILDLPVDSVAPTGPDSGLCVDDREILDVTFFVKSPWSVFGNDVALEAGCFHLAVRSRR
jgi:hypothetical protein